MPRKTRQSLYRAGLAILAGCVLCLIANILLIMAIRYGGLLDDSFAKHPRNSTSDILQELQQEGNAIERSLLIDSILSIVQSYYVDSDRVDNLQVLEHALSSLAMYPDVQYTRSAQGFDVTIGGFTKSITFGSEPSYRDTLKALVELASLVDKKLKKGDADRSWYYKAEVIIVNSLLSSLDAHSALLSPDAYRELRQGTEGSFGGLGVLVGIREQVLTVIKPLPRSPALRAGVQQQDRILSIDGVHTFGYTLDDLVEYMRGDPGTLVRLMVLREGEPHPQLVNLTREIIKVDSVEVDVVEEGRLRLLHLKIENFSSRTSDEVIAALRRHRAEYGNVDGLILDLRSNPGGLLDQAVAVANIFLEQGVILTTKGRRAEVESVNGSAKETDFPVTILINGDSASASEIVAGALQDHERALIIGQPSFGKGSVQTIFELPNQQALKLTIARYYTPLGRSIQNTGIKPDIWVQPVVKHDANKNLLGSLRYKNERYLRNRLEAITQQDLQLTNRSKSFKGYYLVNKELDMYELNRKDDIELEIARTVIGEVRFHYGHRIDAGGLRAGHWLALAAPKVQSFLDKHDAKVVRWLGATHSIDWSRQHANIRTRGSGLDLDIAPQQLQPAEIGGKILLPWKLANRSSHAVGRLSIFVNSNNAGFETQEILIGGLKAGAMKSGFIEVQLPSYLEEGHFPINLGFAVDAVPIPAGTRSLSLELRPKDTADLNTVVSLSDEMGGRQQGALEPGESARLKVVVENRSTVDAKQVTAKIVNLSGAQVNISDSPTETVTVPSGERKVIYIDIKGGKHLYTPELEFGLTLQSEDLREPILRSITLSGQPNMGEIKEVTSMSH